MAEMILNDFIKYNSNKITEEFIQKVDKFIQSYKNKNIHLQDLLDYIVTEKKNINSTIKIKWLKFITLMWSYLIMITDLVL